MLEYRVRFQSEDQCFSHEGPLEFGRDAHGSCERRVILDPSVSRDQLRVEELPNDRVRLVNLSQRVSIQLATGETIGAGATHVAPLPVKLAVGKARVEIITMRDESSARLATIAMPIRPAAGSDTSMALRRLGEAPTPEQLTRWMEAVISVQRAAASSAEFYEQTATAVVDLVGLDIGLVLLLQDGEWAVVGQHTSREGDDPRFSRSILRKVVSERRTFFGTAGEANVLSTLGAMDVVVASPILNEKDEVAGAVYGSRVPGSGSGASEIRPLEAQLVQLLAAAVGSGMARVAREADAARSRVQFEQFFSSELARELERDPGLLEGKEREVTILFADLNGFSRMSERLKPGEVCALVVDVMDVLSRCVLDEKGVVVDYIGDAILAMWNAPAPQPDHAVRACRAALAMRAGLPTAFDKWRERVQMPLGVTIGIGTGPVQVGNIGSRRRFKYGALGHTVNLASRIQGATKQMGAPVLLAGTTADQVRDTLVTRRLCKVRFVGIDGVVDVYELHGDSATEDWLARRECYEKALDHFETKRWSDACRTIYPLLQENQGHYDFPALTLAARAVECLKAAPPNFDPVLTLQMK
ncbi:MAG: adenylate/guanylate cyclase domain-containing protein [Planctomycetes bacterium]|nr:adenylate/guanylate cyclase domain-containing protein [Planctomycetota bacterium]